MKNGVTFVQFRPLFQALDYKVNWNSGNKQVTGTYLDQKSQMTIGQKTAYVNGAKPRFRSPHSRKAATRWFPFVL